ncbi:EAL domain-containing response regulator [Thalassotalea nanhaiensis]|uniref:EAL domain-containing response regulator n=1 Tax=Thalassotalea nanhaiensis TaxID=3065648 RepID=A0ABY9TLM1_9GAMM|nr:EAL domain-containing response regulator [Colwelliaceae bacterium SQ345]
MKVLILEDDPIQNHIIYTYINNMKSCSAKSFFDVHSCLFEMAVIKEPFILITDIHLHQDSVVNIIKELKQFDLLAGLIIVSALDNEVIQSITLLAKLTGIDQVKQFPKPFHKSDLIEAIDEISSNYSNNLLEPTVIPSHQFSNHNTMAYLLDNKFQPYFQPQLCAKTLRITGLEILGRLQVKGKIYQPDTFIQPLIDYHQITRYTLYILDKSLNLLNQYNIKNLTLSLNMEYDSLCEANFAFKLLNILKKHNFPSHKLIVEMTENRSILTQSVVANLAELRIARVNISVDDYGTGQSGIKELINFPFSELKIDRSQIKDMLTSEKAANVVKAIAAMAKALNLNCVAEGVENQQQVDALKAMGVDRLQGFHFCKAVPLYELQQIDEDWNLPILVSIESSYEL